MIGIRPRRRGETNQNQQKESRKPSPLMPHKSLSEVATGGLSLKNKMQRAGCPARCKINCGRRQTGDEIIPR
jgi:hypothetical protein